MASGNSPPSDFPGIFPAFGMTLFMASLTMAAKSFLDSDSATATYLPAFLGMLVIAPFATLGETITAEPGIGKIDLVNSDFRLRMK